jgi:hypothetical protein
MGFSHVRKVSSRFEYILPILSLRLRIILKVVGMDAELNSLSNGDIFEGGHRAKIGLLPQIHPTPLVYPTNIRFDRWDDSKSGWNRCRIKFSIK